MGETKKKGRKEEKIKTLSAYGPNTYQIIYGET